MSEDNLDLNALTPDEFINEKIAGKSDSEIQVELLKLELEMKKQELELRREQLEDMKLDREYKKFDRIVKEDEAVTQFANVGFRKTPIAIDGGSYHYAIIFAT